MAQPKKLRLDQEGKGSFVRKVATIGRKIFFNHPLTGNDYNGDVHAKYRLSGRLESWCHISCRRRLYLQQ
jgi:hypothetical protein